MSKAILKGNASGSGSVTLESPNTNSDLTIAIPARAGNMAIDGPAFSAYMGSSQTISSGTSTKVQFNTVVFDTASCYNTTLYRFTPNVAGYYQISGLATIQTLTTSHAFVTQIYKNGTTYKNGTCSVTNGGLFPVSEITSLVYLNGSTDYVEIYVYADAGSSPTIYADLSIRSEFSGLLARAA